MANGWGVWNQALSGIGGDFADALSKKWQRQYDEEQFNQNLGNFLNKDMSVQSDTMPELNANRVQRENPFAQDNMANIAQLLRSPGGREIFSSLLSIQPQTSLITPQAGEGITQVTKSPGGQIDLRTLREPQFRPSMQQQTRPTNIAPPGQQTFKKVPGTNRTIGVEYLQDANTGQYVKDAYGNYVTQDAAGGSAPIFNVLGGGGKNDLNAALALKKEFRQTPSISYFEDIKPKYDTMREALKIAEGKGDSESFVAADQSLITLFNKMTDPSSVVRESEYARTTEDLAVMSRVKAVVSRWQEGGRLEPNVRKDIMKMSKKFMNVATTRYRSARGDFGKFASDFNLNPTHVTGTDFSSGYTMEDEPTYSKTAVNTKGERIGLNSNTGKWETISK
jgi:hypothetical protein